MSPRQERLINRARALLVAGSRQPQSVQEAYARSGAQLLAMAAEPVQWWDSCHGPDCNADLVRDHDGPDYCSDACRDNAAQDWHERVYVARGAHAERVAS